MRYPNGWTRPGRSAPFPSTTGWRIPWTRSASFAGLAPGEAAMSGVQVGIDAVGFQSHDRLEPGVENPTQVISDLARLVNPTGHLGIIGVYAE
jgi:hypothetical protein